MKTRMTDLAIKTAAVTSICVGLALGGFHGASAQNDRAGNYFDTWSVPAGARTSVDINDPYAPADLSGTAVTAGNARSATEQAAESDSESAIPPMPTLPGRPY